MTLTNRILSGVALVGLMAVAQILPMPDFDNHKEEMSPGSLMAQFLPLHGTAGSVKRELQSISSNVLEIGKDKYRISRAFFKEQVGDTTNLLTTARFVPAIEVSSMKGLAIQSVEKDSLFAQLGLASDDIVQKINGIELNHPSKAQQALEVIKTSKKIELTVKRGEQVRQIAVHGPPSRPGFFTKQ